MNSMNSMISGASLQVVSLLTSRVRLRDLLRDSNRDISYRLRASICPMLLCQSATLRYTVTRLMTLYTAYTRLNTQHIPRVLHILIWQRVLTYIVKI